MGRTAKSENLDALLDDVVGRYDATPDARLREVMVSAVRHLHAFAREVHLSRDELFAAVRFLNVCGQISTGVRQEFFLLSDTLGLTALVEQLAYDASAPHLTDNTVLGPFYVAGSVERERGASMLDDPDEGDRVVVRGRVTNVDGEPLDGVIVDVWQNASNRFYACQQPGVQSEQNLRGVYRTTADGTYELRGVRPVPYPVPSDGPAGDLLRRSNRNWWRPGHLHFWVRHPGYKDLITHVFDSQSEYLDDDAVFGVQPSLVRTFAVDEHNELATTFDIVLDRV